VLVASSSRRRPVERLVLVAPFPTEVDLDACAPRDRARPPGARVGHGSRPSLSRYIAPECSCAGCAGSIATAAIRMLGDRMISAGVIDRAYVEGALERERLSSTAFTEHLAVPHAMTMTARRTAIAIADRRRADRLGRRERERRRR
jgi:lichenan operon transcriptional antiterminator